MRRIADQRRRAPQPAPRTFAASPVIRRWALVVGTAALSLALQGQSASWSVTSPNGLVTFSVQLADLGGKADFPKGETCLYYRVEQGGGEDRAVVIEDSPLGLELEGQDFLHDLQFERATEPRPIEEAYEMPHGKRRQCRNRGRQLTLSFRNLAGLALELDLRAYDDGAAFRYRLPGTGTNLHTLESESSGFALPEGARLWMQPSDKVSTYSPAYETYYENEVAVGSTPEPGLGWAFPVLFRTADARHWGLITEANVGPGYCGTRLSSTAPRGIYRIRLPDPAEGSGYGSAKPSWTLPWEMPWRVIVLGSSLAQIVESTLVTDVSAPSRLWDTSWIRPGRVAWSWWSDPPSPQDGAKQRKFIDLAADMGWEYVLVDANWTVMDHGTIHDVLRYAKGKGVGVLLWYNSGGPHNVVTEKPRDSLYFKEVRRFEFDLLRKWGVKGVKVDFFQSDKQEAIRLYHGLMQDAADFQIMVNFHGCTLPRGWSRTHPNLMSMEAVRGEECYIFDPKFPERAPVQNTITPFTRNVVGPMDYTPVGFSTNRYPHRTTAAHELALAALFESGWVHFADKPEAYLNLPLAPREFLKKLPVAWDDTRFVAGYPGQFVVLARRKGEQWYLTGVNGGNRPRTETIRPGAWLGAGSYKMTLIADGAEARLFASRKQTFKAGQDFLVRMLPFGGFVATLTPAK
jgi:alpha-glucosidase